MLTRYEITKDDYTAQVVAWSIDHALGMARMNERAFDTACAGDVKRLGFADPDVTAPRISISKAYSVSAMCG